MRQERETRGRVGGREGGKRDSVFKTTPLREKGRNKKEFLQALSYGREEREKIGCGFFLPFTFNGSRSLVRV